MLTAMLGGLSPSRGLLASHQAENIIDNVEYAAQAGNAGSLADQSDPETIRSFGRPAVCRGKPGVTA